MENIELTLTEDGSHTLYSERFNQHYHSTFGALQESQRIFIELGLFYAFERFSEIRIFEMGFGTGLNALLTQQLATKHTRIVHYVSIEAFPVALSLAEMLNYDDVISTNDLQKLHKASWNEEVQINDFFSLEKVNHTLENYETQKRFNLVYYDAFAPEVQPELWTQEIFEKLASMMETGGILTTYCSKGYVRRNLQAAGFSTKKHKGPIGKREVLRAIRI